MKKDGYGFKVFGWLSLICLVPEILAGGYILQSTIMIIIGYVYILICLICICIPIILNIYNDRKELELQEAIVKSNISQIDNLNPYAFEEWVARLLRKMGYKATPTKRSGDYGIDVIAENNQTKIGIQVKKFNKPVGIKAVQEVISGMVYYDCNKGWVVTSTNSFTQAAINLANKRDIKLITRNDLAKMLSKLQSDKI